MESEEDFGILGVRGGGVMDGEVDEWMNEWRDGEMDGWRDGEIDGWRDDLL